MLEHKAGGASCASAAGRWLDDDDQADVEATAAETDALELDVFAAVRQVQKLTAALHPGRGGAAVPDAVDRFAPPPPRRKTSYDALAAAGHPAAAAIDTWRRSGSAYSAQRAQQRPHADPYASVQEEVVGRRRRQELFSFAVVQLLDLGKAEAAALLLSRDTGARLQYALHALQPFVAQLAAKASVKGALGQ